MKYIITYVSYNIHSDHETYYDKVTALRRYAQLATCKNVSKLEMREI